MCISAVLVWTPDTLRTMLWVSSRPRQPQRDAACRWNPAPSATRIPHGGIAPLGLEDQRAVLQAQRTCEPRMRISNPGQDKGMRNLIPASHTIWANLHTIYSQVCW